jgi:hypothetical protein
MGGIVGAMIQSQLRKVAVSSADLKSFLDESPPRTIPAGMKRQVLGGNFPLIVIGTIFLIAGLVAGSLTLTLAKGAERWIGLPFLIIFPLVGGLMSGLTLRHRRRKSRVLREGSLAEGMVTAITRTSTSVNNQTRYHITVEYSVDGQTRSTRCNAYGLAVEQARVLKSSGAPARILVDPLDPDHVVCVDLLTVLD